MRTQPNTPPLSLAAVAIALAGALAATGCQDSTEIDPTAAPVSSVPIEAEGAVRVALASGRDETAAGFLAADALGFFDAVGFDSVSFVASSDSALDQVIAGDLDYAVVSPYELATADAADLAAVRVVGPLFAAGDINLVTLESQALEDPAQLAGLTVAVSEDNAFIAGALTRAEGVDTDSVEIVTTEDPLAALGSGQADAALVSSVDLALRSAAGLSVPRATALSEFGVSLASDLVVTSAETVEGERATVRAFALAVIQGWNAAKQNPAQASDLVQSVYGSTVDPAASEALVRDVATAVVDSGQVLLITEAQVQSLQEALAAADLELPSELFDTTLVQQVYDSNPSLAVTAQ